MNIPVNGGGLLRALHAYIDGGRARSSLGVPSFGARAVRLLGFAVVFASCSNVAKIEPTGISPISNDDTFATLAYLWGGAQSAIQKQREPLTDVFNLPLSYQLPCTRGGSGTYQGTLSGRKTAGVGSATLAMTATLSACAFDDKVVVTTISASGVTITGTIDVANDAWSLISLKMVATSVTVNGVVCPGGVDVLLTGLSPSTPPVSTGTACGRTGSVALP